MEFGLPVDVVKSWPLKKYMKYTIFLEMYYKRKYGDPDDYEDMDRSVKMPNVPKNPKSALRKAKNLGRIKGRKNSGHGASGHTYKFR